MTIAEELASFVVRASYDDLSEQTILQLKIRVLDSLGCAIGALEGEPITLLRWHLHDFGGKEQCTLIGGGRTAPDRAVFYNSALIVLWSDTSISMTAISLRAKPVIQVIISAQCSPRQSMPTRTERTCLPRSLSRTRCH